MLGINGVPSWEAEPLHARVGDTELWYVSNEMDWAHPFHLHGFFFQVLDQETGAPLTALGWKDTVNVPRQTDDRASPFATTIAPACGCSTATSWTTPMRG